MLGDLVGGGLADADAGGGAAGEGDAADAGAADEGGAGGGAVAEDEVEDAARQADAPARLGQQERRRRRHLGRLRHRRAPERQARRRLPRQQVQRHVPRRYQGEHPRRRPVLVRQHVAAVDDARRRLLVQDEGREVAVRREKGASEIPPKKG